MLPLLYGCLALQYFPKADSKSNGLGPSSLTTEHLLGCSRSGGTSRRHHAVVNELSELLRRAGHVVANEVALTPTLGSKSLRMDIESTPPNGDPLWIDVTVANSIGRTHKGKPLDTTFDKKDAEKKNTYATLAKEKNVQLLTFACDVFGTLSKDSLNLLRTTASAIKLRAPDASSVSFPCNILIMIIW